MYSHDLPQVIEFNHAYDVKVEHDGNSTRVVARLKPSKYRTQYSKFHDLPFVSLNPETQRYHWWLFPVASNWTEQTERGDYFFEEFVRYVRGPQKKRRDDAIQQTVSMIEAMFDYHSQGLENERRRFLSHLAEALVGSLRVGVDQ